MVLPPTRSTLTGDPIPNYPETVGDIEELSAGQIDGILFHLGVRESPSGLELLRGMLKEKIRLEV